MAKAPQLNDDFRDLLTALNSCAVEFLVVGAHALAAHGIVRATGDLDVWVRPTAANARRVHQALLQYGAPLAAHDITVADFARRDTVYQIGLPPRRIDLLTSISGVEFVAAWKGRTSISIDGLKFGVLGRRQLLANKRASGRDKDLLDLRLLQKRTRERGKTS